MQISLCRSRSYPENQCGTESKVDARHVHTASCLILDCTKFSEGDSFGSQVPQQTPFPVRSILFGLLWRLYDPSIVTFVSWTRIWRKRQAKFVRGLPLQMCHSCGRTSQMENLRTMA